MANLSERLRDLADEGELIHLYPHDLLCRRLREAATILDRLQSLSDQNRLTGGWRDIESAPKDRKVDLWVEWPAPERSSVRCPGSYWVEEQQDWMLDRGCMTHQYVCRPTPTHWREAPSPPLPLPGGEEKR